MPQDSDPQQQNPEGAKGGSVSAAADQRNISTRALLSTGISFAPIWSGLLAGFALYLLIGAIGLAIFATQAATALSAGIIFSGAASGLAIWLGITALIALFVGGVIAAHLSQAIGTMSGIWRGVILWGLVFTLIYLMGGLGSSAALAAIASTRATPAALSAAAYSTWGMTIFQFLGLLAAAAGGAAGAIERHPDVTGR